MPVAISDYDTLAFDTEGKPCSGSVEFGKTGVCIYKNWVYVSNPELWKDGYSYVESTIAEIKSGIVTLAGVSFEAIRDDKQDSIFVYCRQGYGKEERKFCGIGCRGYLDTPEALKLTNPSAYASIPKEYLTEDWEFFGTGFGGAEGVSLSFLNRKTDQIQSISLDVLEVEEVYVGVQEETYNTFMEWLVTVDKKYAAKVFASTPERFNQGDAFFKEHLDLADKVNTPIGEQNKTIMSKMLGK